MALVLKPENVAQLVFFIRGEKVLLDADLAMLYGVEARSLNQAVARNRKRFPADFMFQLSTEEYENIRSQFVTTSAERKLNSSQSVMSSQIVISKQAGVRGASPLRSQFVISNTGRGGRRYRPYAFTEQGVAMLSSACRAVAHVGGCFAAPAQSK